MSKPFIDYKNETDDDMQIIELEFFDLLADAKDNDKAIVVFEGDFGGQIYLVCWAKDVKCPDKHLDTLLQEIDSKCWSCNEYDGAFFQIRETCNMELRHGVSGGCGGGEIPSPGKIWVHKEIESMRGKIEAVIFGMM